MLKFKKIICILVIAFLCFICLDVPIFGQTIRKPVIYSYYWPVSEKGKNDLFKWNMTTPTIIDVPSHYDNSQWIKAKNYWESNGKIILDRVSFHSASGSITEAALFNRFVENMERSKGIAIDEITTKITKPQAEAFINVLKKVRRNYPDRVIAVWCAGNWTTQNAFVLEAIRDYADIFIPEIYISQKTSAKWSFARFQSYMNATELLAPGITKKLVVGLGMYSKMKDDPSKSFADHLAAQITLLGTDPFFKDILGIALYAPVYNTAEDQKRIDTVINKYFNR